MGGRLFGTREYTEMLVYRSFHSNDIYLFKVNNGKSGKMCEICSKLTITTPERPHWRCSGVLLLTSNIFHTLLWCFLCWIWTSKYRVGMYGYNKIQFCFAGHFFFTKIIFNFSWGFTFCLKSSMTNWKYP